MHEEERKPGQEYGLQSPPALPPPLPPSPQRVRPAVARRPPVRRLAPVIDREAAMSTGWMMTVTLSVWVAVGMGAVLLWLARPRTIEGIGSMLATLLYLPLVPVLLLASIATLLHGLARQGWAFFSKVMSWVLLTGLLALHALYGPVKAVRQLTIV